MGKLAQYAQQIKLLAQTIIQSPEEAIARILSMGDKGRQLVQMLVEAAQEGDQDAALAVLILQQALSEIPEQKQGGVAEYLHYLKCGGKVKKTPKKAVKGAKAPCPCILKRVGGVLIQVNTCD